MGVTVVFVLAALVSASIGDDTVVGQEHREVVETVSAPQGNSSYTAEDISQQIPILSLLTQKKSDVIQSPESDPIYVETPEEQGKDQGRLNRQKRHKGIKYGGYGGGGNHGYQQPIFVYQIPTKHGQSQGGCGRCGGGGGNGGAYSGATAIAIAQSGGYGKK